MLLKENQEKNRLVGGWVWDIADVRGGGARGASRLAAGAGWLVGGWVGASLGFRLRWQVGGWVPFWGFLRFLIRGLAKKRNPEASQIISHAVFFRF
jgi:hypothetical protein